MKQFWLGGTSQRFSTRLMLGFVLLVLATTLGAGLPAYWLTSSQLEAQSWSRVEGAQKTTLSLLEAARMRLEDALLLFVERPTLHHLLAQDQREALEEYIANFKRRSGLDLLLVCDATGAPLSGDPLVDSCPSQEFVRFTTLDARPVLLASATIDASANNQADANQQRALIGMWLDGAFLQQLAATTGVEQSFFAQDGTLLATTLDPTVLDNLATRLTVQTDSSTPTSAAIDPTRYTYDTGTIPYFALRVPVTNSDDTVDLTAEVALSVELLRQTERRAIAILLTSTSLIALLGVILGVLYIRRLTRPLQTLTTAAETIAVGHLTAPIPSYQSPHEVATLARALAASQQSLLAALGERSKARDWLLTLIQSVVEGVITLDNAGRVTFFSQGAEHLSGWSSQEALGHMIDEIFPLARADDGSFFQTIPAPGQRRRLEVLTRQGEVMALAITGTQMVPPTGIGAETAIAQTALVIRNISDEEMLDQMHSYFLANLTHEFQTPLSTLNASLELLMENVDELSPDELRALLHPARLSLLGLQNLVNNLLASSAIEAGRFTLRLRATNVQQVIADSLQLVQPLFERRQQSFTLGEAASVAALPEIQADRARLTLALTNLLTNASKYSPDGATIDLAVREEDEWLRLAVADRGPGVPPGAQAQLFNRFVRLEEPQGDQASTGLGLFVVKSTAEAHGGRVGIEDRPGGGAIFWIEIPRKGSEVAHENLDRGGRSRPLRYSRFHSTPRRLRSRPRL